MLKWDKIEFGKLYLEPSRNGLNRPTRMRGQGYKMVNMGEIFAYDRINNQDMELVPMNEKEESKFNLKPKDLLFARQSLVDSGVGKCSIVLETPELITFESHLIRIRLDPKKTNPPFYYYYFISPQGKANIQSLMMQAAAAGIRGSELAKLKVPFPNRTTQSKIATTLSDYDDLIENNNRRIQILEKITQTVYNEYFIKFRFPGHIKVKMVNAELGKIPEGWEVLKVGDVIERFPSGKKYDNKTVLPKGKVPVLDQGRSGIIGYHNNEPDVMASEDEPIIIFANHTCYQRIIMFPFSAIQNVIPFLPRRDRRKDIYWLHWATKDVIKFNDYKGHFPEFTTKKIIFPPADICSAFAELIKPMLQLRYKLEQKNKILQENRDLLLPKLISGEIDVEHLDIKTEEIE